MVKLIKKALDGLVDLLTDLAHVIFLVPSPNIGSAGGGGFQPSETLGAVWGSLSWIVMAVGVISMLIAIMRMIWTLQATEGRVIIRMMINLVASTTVIVGMTSVAIKASDRFSPWVLEAISGRREKDLVGEKFAHQLLGSTVNGGGGLPAMGVVALVLIIIAEVAVVAQIIFMIVRAPLIIAMVAFIPLFAASSGTPKGQERFTKSLAFLLAFVLYKPVAAILYGIGLRMMRAAGDEGSPVMQFLWGTTLFVLIAFALPAMIKFFVAEAAVGSSNAFSGAAGIAAAGAAVYGAASLGAALSTGGGSAAAQGAGHGAMAAAKGAGPTPPGGGGQGGGDGGGGGGGNPPPPGGGTAGGLCPRCMSNPCQCGDGDDDSTPPGGGAAAAPASTGGAAPGADQAEAAGGETARGDGGAAAAAPAAAEDSGPVGDADPAPRGGAETEGGSAYDGSPHRDAPAQEPPARTSAAHGDSEAGPRETGEPGAVRQDAGGPGGHGGYGGYGAPGEQSYPPQHTREGVPFAGSRAKQAANRRWQTGRGAAGGIGRGATLVGATAAEMGNSVDQQDVGGQR